MVESPESLLNGGGSLRATTLSVSDNHATVLLQETRPTSSATNDVDGAATVTRSLMKMNVVPAHRSDLACLSSYNTLEELNAAPVDEASSKRILAFLHRLDFRLTSESGAEYSYYTAFEKSWWRNPLGFVQQIVWPQQPNEAFKVELISPASDRQVERSLPTPGMALVEETPHIYESIVKPTIDKLVESGSLSWIANVVNGEKESERLLLNEDTFILNVDTKWKTHPDALAVPREQWYEHKSVEDLCCLAIVKDGSLHSIRDLRGSHVPMLRAILTKGREAITRVYGVSADQLRVFLHYQPQFYHLHVHFTRIENEIGSQVERGHLLLDVIQNLEMAHDFYAKRTLTYKLKISSEMYSLIHQMKP